MAREISYLEAEEIVDKFTDPSRNIGIAEAFDKLMNEPPEYITALEFLRQAVKQLQSCQEPCTDDCNHGHCIGKPAHQKVVAETVTPHMETLIQSVADMRLAIIDMVYRTVNCKCQYCERQDMINHAPLN